MSTPGALAVRGRHLAELALPSLDEPWASRTERVAAMAWLASHGVPNAKDEDWRYTDLRGFLGLTLTPARPWIADPALEAVVASASLGLGGPRLVLVNGMFAAGLSDLGTTATGLSVAISDNHADIVGGGSEVAWQDGFAALNHALSPHCLAVTIPTGATVAAPIEVLFLSMPAASANELSSPRLRLILGASSAATIVELHTGQGGSTYVVNGACEVMLGNGARLTHDLLVDEPEGAHRLMARRVLLGEASEYRSHLVSLGSRLARDEVRVELAGANGLATLDACYLAGEGCHQDHPIRVEHAASGGVSRQRVRGVVAGDGHGVFNGHVIVRPGANGTDASQHDANLVCSDRAEIDTRPRLEIFADDVACVHGATVGRLDPDALFYLRSRGIDERTARRLLTAAFIEELLAAILVESLRDRARVRVAAHLVEWWPDEVADR